MSDLPPIASISAKENAINTTTAHVDIVDAEELVPTPVTVLALPPKYSQLTTQIALELRVPPPNADGSYTFATPAGPLILQLPNLPPTQNHLGLVLMPSNTAGNPVQATVLLPTTIENAAKLATNIAGNMVNTLIDAILPEAVILPAALPGVLPPPVSPGQILNAYPLPADTVLAPDNAGPLLNPLNTTTAPPNQVLASMPHSLPQTVGTLSVPGRLLATIENTLQSLQQQGNTPLTQLPQNRAILQQVLPEPAAGPSTAAMRWQVLASVAAGQELPAMPDGEAIWHGKVIAQTAQGLPVVQLAVAAPDQPPSQWVLPAAKGLPTGTQLWLQGAPEIETTTSLPIADLPDFKPGQDKHWPALETTLQQLINQDMQLNATIVSSLPKLNAQLPITTLFFLSALRTGDVRNWLGETGLDRLRATGRGADALAKLDKEFKQIRENAETAEAGEWKNYPIPFADINGLSVMDFFVRRYNGEPLPEDDAEFNHGKPKQPDARFVVEIGFSELGAVQIDGLIRRKDGHRLLDMVVRTQTLLPADLRNTLREGFFNVLGATAVTGTLAFQAGSHNWLRLRK